MSNPTDNELLTDVYSETHQAAACVSKAWVAGAFTRKEGDEMLSLLQRATAAMTSLHCRLRGVPPPKIGE